MSKRKFASVGDSAQPSRGNWEDALWPYCDSPEKHPSVVYDFDDEIVVVRDKYPKAAHHFLVMPRVRINGYRELNASHLPLLKKMHERGKQIREEILNGSEGKGAPIRLGFHAIPSMKQLHMHVISQDFDSTAMKNKKHWNSFTTSFFREFDDITGQLHAKGKVYFAEHRFEELLKSSMVCHVCDGVVLKNIPTMKAHMKQRGHVERLIKRSQADAVETADRPQTSQAQAAKEVGAAGNASSAVSADNIGEAHASNVDPATQNSAPDARKTDHTHNSPPKHQSNIERYFPKNRGLEDIQPPTP